MILAGDIGGTNARLALFDVQNNEFKLQQLLIYPSRHYSGLDQIVGEFVSNTKIHPTQACFGIAGPVNSGRVEASNLPWVIESKRLAAELSLDHTVLINDLEATGWGIGALPPSDLVPLNNVISIAGAVEGNQAVIAAGTGLGEGGLYWDGTRHHVFASEGGHCDFAPQGDLQVELYKYLSVRFAGHVSCERVLSGPGLINIFEFLRDTGKGKPPDWLVAEMVESDAAATISNAAMEGQCPMCEQALSVFVSIFGAEAGNLALKIKATGGVFLAGGIAPKILPKLSAPMFLESFLSKGRLRHLMEIMPIQVITNDKLGLLGAARCAFLEAAA